MPLSKEWRVWKDNSRHPVLRLSGHALHVQNCSLQFCRTLGFSSFHS